MTQIFEDGRTTVRDDNGEAVRASVDIAAAPDAVFRALVEPRERAAWLGGGDPRDGDDASDGRGDEHGTGSGLHQAQPGARWHSHAVAPDGTRGTVAGEYLHVAPPHRLDTTWRASWNDFALEHVRFELFPIEVDGAPGTRVTVTHTRLPRGARATARLGTSLVHPVTRFPGDDWPATLVRLAAYAATRSLAAHWTGGAPDSHWFDTVHRAVVSAAKRPR